LDLAAGLTIVESWFVVDELIRYVVARPEKRLP
jgi:hypothetical protein